MEIIDRMKEALDRVDGWANLITGVGTARKSKRLSHQPDAILADDVLEGLFADDPYAATICQVIPEEALRQGYAVKTGAAAEEAAITTALADWCADEHLALAWTWARVFGGGAIYVGADDGLDPREPLNEAAIRSVRFLDVVDKRELQPDRYQTDRLARNFGQPETYRLQRSGNGGASDFSVVHRSRLVIFPGGATTRPRRQMLNGWGQSELQRIYDVLAKFNGGFEASGTLLQVSSESVFTLRGLMSMMAADKKDILKRRLEMMDLARGVTGSVLLDEGETYTRTEVGALTGVAQLLDKNLLLLAGAARIPVTILMGQSPAGLSATGDSDVRWFYDRVKTQQTGTLRRRHLQLIRLLCLAHDGPTKGRVPASLAIQYAPLWQLTPLEQADLRQKQATTDGIYIDKQVVTADEVGLSRFRPEGYSAETTVDLDARRAAAEGNDLADAAVNAVEPPGADHAEAAGDIIARVAARELPRDSGVALLVSSLGMDPAAAEAAMGEAGRTHFTAPDPTDAAGRQALEAENKKLKASNQGHKQFTARVIQAAKDGGVQLGAFTSQAPTETAEGDELQPGDVVAVPPQDGPAETPPSVP